VLANGAGFTALEDELL